jgi:hypothetical protein
MFLSLLLYKAIPLVRRHPSPGACIMGYAVLPDGDGNIRLGRAAARAFVGFFGVCAWFITPFFFRDRNRGKVWFDKAFGTHAVRLV